MRPLIGTHPSGSVRIGTMLDTNLQTEIEGLYVCDASVFPESLDRPTVLTIISLAKRFAGYWLSKNNRAVGGCCAPKTICTANANVSQGEG